MKNISSFGAMKGLVTLALFAFGTSFASAQYYVNVWQKDGTRIQYTVDEIEQVSFTDHKLPDFKSEAVDLGLSVQWASCNVGALQANDWGKYFNWGDTEEESEGVSDYKWCDPTTGMFTKYNLYTKLGSVDMKYRLDSDDDIAHVGAGPNWRIPTDEEFQELIDSCIWTWKDSSGVSGYVVQSKKNGNSIFLPASGLIDSGTLRQKSGKGAYLSNTLYIVSTNLCRILNFDSNFRYVTSNVRTNGYSVRPVYSSDFGNNQFQISSLILDTTTVELKVGKTYSLNVAAIIPDGGIISIGDIDWRSDNEEVAIVKSGVITAVGEGTCTITAIFGYNNAKCQVSVIDASKPQDPVDLGLSVKWSRFNIGATDPSEPGDYYAWGETTPKTEYSWATYKYCNGSDTTLTKYNSYPKRGFNGFTDGKTVLDPDDDVAAVRWKGNWRMPYGREFNELVDSCNWKWTTLNGTYGYLVTSNVKGYTDQSIFLPAAGYIDGTSVDGVGYGGEYWSASLSGSYSRDFYFNNSSYQLGTWTRTIGTTIRPVYAFDAADIKGIIVDKKELAMTPGGEDEVNTSFTDGNGRVIGINGTVNISWRSSNDNVATVTDGAVKAVGDGNCTVTAIYGNYTATCSVTVKDPANVTPESVDLGLSVKWASFNLGAFAPEMLGDYYAWGETEPYYEAGSAQSETPDWKDDKEFGYVWANYFDTNDGGKTFLKYSKESGKTQLDLEDDAAYVAWKGLWRIPSEAHFQELLDSCDWTETTVNGVGGYKVTSKVKGFENNSIFLPYAGYRDSISLDLDDDAYYWSSTINVNAQSVSTLSLDEDDAHIYNDNRHWGQSYRPVEFFSDANLQSLQLNAAEKDLGIGQNYTMILRGVLANGRTVALSGIINWTSSKESVATVTDGVVKAVGTGIATITATYQNGLTKSCTVNVVDPYDVQPEYVNLGLSVNWATFNIGAFKPEVYGDYFAWGTNEPYYEAGGAQSLSPTWKDGYSDGYAWSDYFDTDDEGESFNKYYQGALTTLEAEDDAAFNLWGDGWRLPTSEEFDELLNKCSWELYTMDGVDGYLITSMVNGYENNSIFLPLTGLRGNQTLYDPKIGVNGGRYWSSTLNNGSNQIARYLWIGYDDEPFMSRYQRSYGFSIRPVRNNDDYEDGPIVLTDNITVQANDYIGGVRNENVTPRTVNDPANYSNGCYIVTTNSDFESNSDAQLIITVDQDIEPGQFINFSMRVKADAAQSSGTSVSFVSGGEKIVFGYDPIESPSFSTEWQYYKGSYRVRYDDLNIFNFNLSYLDGGNNCYFDDISVTVIDPFQGDFSLDEDSISLEIGSEYYLKAYDDNYNYEEYAEWSSSNDQVATVGYQGNIKAVSAGTAIITATYHGVSKSCKVTVTPYVPVTAYVDLGLSVNWATCNIGAKAPDGYGFYYAWGETESTKPSYSWDTYALCNNGSSSQLTKYNNDSSYGYNGFEDDLTELDATDDVASVLMGGTWRMATSKEFQELLNMCSWEWTYYNDNYGYKITSNVTGYTDRSIFLPAAGYYFGAIRSRTGSEALYWSRSLAKGYEPPYAELLYFDYSDDYYVDYCDRYAGGSIRPVAPKADWQGITSIEMEDNVTLTEYDEYNLSYSLMSGKEDYTFMFEDDLSIESSNEDVVTVDEMGHMVAVAPGNATITLTYKQMIKECQVTVKAFSFCVTGQENSIDYVDLGLSVKWATYNVGANTPTGYGDYYAWGETEPHYETGYAQEAPQNHWKTGYSDGYTWSTYFDTDDEGNTFSKYNNGDKEELDDEDDVAVVKWGGDWRMPTGDELEELYNGCTWSFITVNGVSGYKGASKVKGYEDRFIFLPASGGRPNAYIDRLGTYVMLWSRSICPFLSDMASFIYFLPNMDGVSNTYRYQGMVVRPVCPKE